jgi:two-component system cell cycle sensor histidine kinase/response regulator CckA
MDAAWKRFDQPMMRSIVRDFARPQHGVMSVWAQGRRRQRRHEQANETEARRRATNARFAHLLGRANEAVFLSDEDGRFLEVNDRALEMYGYRREELLSLRLCDLAPPEGRAAQSAPVRQVLETGSPFAQTVHMKADCTRLQVEFSTRRVDIDGEFLLQSIVRDITERKKAEEALKQSEGQLRQAQKMEAIGRLAGGIAHDFNNLLTAIIGYSDLILASEECAAESLRRDVEEIKAAGERGSALTRQILAFSRREPLQPEVLSLNEILTNMRRFLVRTLGEDIDLAMVLDPELGLVDVDRHQFEQVLLNLTLNARDAMPDGGRLTLETANVELDDDCCRVHGGAEPGAYVMLAVSDTGVGMNEETKSHVFEPFFTTKEPGKGTGLGLATLYGTVKQSGGSVFVYSEPGQGTTFKVYLPRINEPAKARTAAVMPASLLGCETILAVEDDVALRALIKRVLERLGYTILTAGNGDEALSSLHGAGPVDLLLTDVALPGSLQGDELVQAARALRPDLPALYMSGYTLNAVMRSGRLDQGVNYLEKPFTPADLARRVREVLDCQASAQE